MNPALDRLDDINYDFLNMKLDKFVSMKNWTLVDNTHSCRMFCSIPIKRSKIREIHSKVNVKVVSRITSVDFYETCENFLASLPLDRMCIWFYTSTLKTPVGSFFTSISGIRFFAVYDNSATRIKQLDPVDQPVALSEEIGS